jgi:hypothetical protein
LPVDGKKVQEFRITLGTKEREIADSIATSLRLASIDQEHILKTLYDPTKIIEIMYSIATIAEILGVETGLPTVADLPSVYNWFATRDATGELAAVSGQATLLQTIKDFLTGSGPFEGTFPGGY